MGYGLVLPPGLIQPLSSHAASKDSVSPGRKMRPFLFVTTALVCLGGPGSRPLAAQTSTGPLAPPKQPDIVRLPTKPAPDKPPIPVDEIIRRFTANEDETAQAREGYIYRRTVRLEEIGADGKPSGHAEITTEFTATDNGNWRPRTVRKPDSSLRTVDLEPDAIQMLSAIPLFPLTTSQLPRYEITYQTAEPVDELMTYVFQVTPKQLDRERAYFSGLIWVDDHDLAIVKTYGKWVSEIGDMKPSNLPFTLYETYRQPVSNRYWMPAYSRSDGLVKGKDSSVAVRLIVRWDDYKQVTNNAAPAAATSPIASSR